MLLNGITVGTGSLYSSCSFLRKVGLVVRDDSASRLRLTSEAQVSWPPCRHSLAGAELPNQLLTSRDP